MVLWHYLELGKRAVARKGEVMSKQKRVWKWEESEILSMVTEYKRLAGRVMKAGLITHKGLCTTVGAVLGLSGVSVEGALRNHVENSNYPPHVPDDDFMILKTWMVEREDTPNPIPRDDGIPWINPRVGEILKLVEKKNEEMEEKCGRYDKHFDAMGTELEVKKKRIRELEKKVKSLKAKEFELMKKFKEQASVEDGFYEKFQAKYGVAAPGGGK